MSVEKQIFNGPGKSDLMFGLFDEKVLAFNCETQRKNLGMSSIIPTHPIQVKITSLEKEDGSGNRWNFKAIDYRTNEIISGFYDHNTKKGVLKVKKKFQITG